MKKDKGYQPVHLPPWFYLDGKTFTMNGETQTLNIPPGCEIIEISAENSAVYYSINDPPASGTDAPGYVPPEGWRLIPPIANLQKITLWGIQGDAALAHVQYWRE